MESQKYSINTFLMKIEPIKITSIPIEIRGYFNFEQPPKGIVIDGEFSISMEHKNPIINLDKNPSSISQIYNPFLEIIFTRLQDKCQLILPCYRILSVEMNGQELHCRFIAHGSKPIQNTNSNDKFAWGDIIFKGDIKQLQLLHKTFLQILYISNKSKKPRCKICQGLKFLIYHEIDNPNMMITNKNLICFDCLQSNINYYNSLFTELQTFINSQEKIQDSEEFIEKIEVGLNLAENLGNESFKMEILILQALFLIKLNDTESIQNSIELLENIVLFASSWKLDEITEKATQLLDKTKKSLNENEKEQLEHTITQTGIYFLQKAKQYEMQGKYQNSINCIYKAAEPLVESGIWDDKDLRTAQGEVARLKAIIRSKNKEQNLERVKIPEIKNMQLNKAQPIQSDEPINNDFLDLHEQSNINTEDFNREMSKNNFEFNKLEEDPIDLGLAQMDNLDFTIKEPIKANDLKITARKELKNNIMEPIKIEVPDHEIEAKKTEKPSEEETKFELELKELEKTLQKKNTISNEPPKLEFTLPDDIPMDEDAEALAEALNYKPDQNEIQNLQPNKLSKLEFTLPDDIPMDEDAEALAEALNYTPDQNDIQNLQSNPPSKIDFSLPENIPMNEDIKSLEDPFNSSSGQIDSENRIINENDPLSMLERKVVESNKVGFQEVSSSNKSIFGLGVIQPHETKKQNNRKMFELFSYNSKPDFPNPKQQTSETGQKSISSKKKNVLLNRSKSMKKKKQKVLICPMCAKTSKACNCGYMRAVNKK